MFNSLDIIITSYNGKKLLEKHLPTVIKNSPKKAKISIYDDAGSDDTGEFLKKNYPKIKFTRNKKNLGFTKNTNLAVKQSKADYVVLLNNDVSPEKDYIQNALKHFKEDKNLFAVSFAEKQFSWPLVELKNGRVQFTEALSRKKAHYILWPSGGSAIIKRKIWNELGGFNEIYTPGYWEDIDIGWRAYTMGYRVVWEPNAKVDHQHESTFKKLNPQKVALIKQRNELLFHWLNLRSAKNLIDLEMNTNLYTLKHPGYLRVVLKTALATPKAFIGRPKHKRILSDDQILSLVNQPV